MNGRLVLIALLVLAVAATPSVTDAYRGWQEAPETRRWIVGSYLFAAVVVLVALRNGWEG
jgi:hypothetical protein